jgi:hypothetical protein
MPTHRTSQHFPGGDPLSSQQRGENRARGFNALADAGYVFVVKNGAAHLIVDSDRGTIDFWPGTEKWSARATGERGRGIATLMSSCKPVGTPTSRPVMPIATEVADLTTIT